MKKKVFAAIIILTFVLALLTACGDKADKLTGTWEQVTSNGVILTELTFSKDTAILKYLYGEGKGTVYEGIFTITDDNKILIDFAYGNPTVEDEMRLTLSDKGDELESAGGSKYTRKK